MHLNCHPTEVSLPWCWSSLLAGPAALDEYVSRTSHRSPALSYTAQTGHSLSRVTHLLPSLAHPLRPLFSWRNVHRWILRLRRIEGKKKRGCRTRTLDFGRRIRGGGEKKKKKSFVKIPCVSLVFFKFRRKEKKKKERCLKKRTR